MWFNLREFSLTQIYPPKVTVLKDMILHFFLHLSQSEKLSEIKPPLAMVALNDRIPKPSPKTRVFQPSA